MLNDALAWGSCIGAWEILLSLSQNWKFGLDERLNSEFSAALLEFNREAVVYCKGISRQRRPGVRNGVCPHAPESGKGNRRADPKIPVGLFEPNRNLIRSTLDRCGKSTFQIEVTRPLQSLPRGRDS